MKRLILEAMILTLFACAVALTFSLLHESPQGTNGGIEPTILTLSPTEAIALAEQNNVIFVDARDRMDFVDGHVAGAVNLPFTNSGQRQEPLTLVLYCSDTSCGKAANLAEIFKAQGLRLAVMPEGMQGWFPAGGAMEAE